jgi:L-ascorbate metabolism protein UlaG (beta-lactamase superfamily)
LGKGVSVYTVPAAHPRLEHDAAGRLTCVGYVLQYADKRIYVAGDTMVCEELLAGLKALPPIDVALLPVNEHNFFRGRRGIIGNMSIRDAFGLAGEVGIRTVIPVHWDMFAVNSAYPEEIEIVYRKMQPAFELRLAKCPETVAV